MVNMTHKMLRRTWSPQLEIPHWFKMSFSQSNPSTFSCLIWSCICLMGEWMLWLCEDKLKQQNPLNSSYPCLWANNKKSMAALFWRVACLVVSSSPRSWVSAPDTKSACLPSQHSRWESSPRAFATATPGTKIEAATLSEYDQSNTSLLQFGSNSCSKRFWWANCGVFFPI